MLTLMKKMRLVLELGNLVNDDLPEDDTEFHLEEYYKIALSDHSALTSDFQYVGNPLGDVSNDDFLLAC